MQAGQGRWYQREAAAGCGGGLHCRLTDGTIKSALRFRAGALVVANITDDAQAK